MQADVTLFTDGACSGNPGPGGWGAILRHMASGKERELCGFEPHTTNNRMELSAVIEGLKALKRSCRVHVVTDSQYVMQGATQWLHGWKARSWKKADKKPVENSDLWQALDTEMKKHTLTWEWVRGHTGHAENERADALARAAIAANADMVQPTSKEKNSTVEPPEQLKL